MTPISRLTLTLAAVAVSAATLIPAAALAQGLPQMEPPSFAELDANGDGQITRADLTAFAAARFAAADTDNNGVLSAAELQAQAQQRAAERAARMGTRMLNQLDANGDGGLSLDELQARGGRGGGDMGARLLERADTDGDGAVSEAEYAQAQEKMRERGGRRGPKGEHGKRHGDGPRERRGN